MTSRVKNRTMAKGFNYAVYLLSYLFKSYFGTVCYVWVISKFRIMASNPVSTYKY